MTDPLIARLDALAQEATPGDWYRDASSYRSLCAREDGVLVMGDGGRAIWSNDDDPAFIAALVTAWPVLRKRLEAGDAARDALAAVADQYEGNACGALRDYLNGIDSFDEVQKDVMRMADIAYAGIDAYDAATTKETP